MNIFRIKIYILLAIFIISGNLIAQTNSNDTSDISKYFDDGRISNAKNVIKFNAISIITGDLPIYYERIINRQISIEAGIGLLLPYYGYEFPKNPDGNQYVSDPDGGYSIWIHPKYYYGRAPEDGYFGLQYRRRSYKENGFNIVYTDYTVNYGFQYYFGSRYVMDINFGLGIRTEKVPDDFPKEIYELDKITFVAPFGIRLGILF